MFFAATDHARLVDRDTLNSWLEKAEKRAKLERLDGGLWHPYRRKWRPSGSITRSRMLQPQPSGRRRDADGPHAGHDETVLAAMSEPRKLRDAQVAK